jgi:hypothetical protein
MLEVHPKIKLFLIVSLKNAVNAVLMNSALMLQWHFIFNFNNLAGALAVLKATASVVGTREAMIWGPKLLKWSQTTATPNGPPAP